MTEYDFKSGVITALQKILAEIEAYEVLPYPGSDEAVAMGAQWGVKFDGLTEKKRRAVNLTLILLPPDVKEIIGSIEQAVYDRQQSIKK
jgi:hypothetical protein